MARLNPHQFSRQLRERMVARRAAKLAERGRPPEHWNADLTETIDRDQMIRDAVDQAVKAAIAQQAGPVAETEPTRPAEPETPAAPPAPKRELHELSTEELRAATREDLNRLLAHLDDGETRPISPFWRDQDAPKAHGDQ